MPALKITDADAGALSFAHLAGLAAPRSEKGDEDKDYDSKKSKKASDEDDEDDKNEQDHSNGDSKKSKKAKRAEVDDDEDDDKKNDAEGDDDSPDDDDKKSSKKAKRADDGDGDGDEDDEPEMRGNSPVARARRREQARCAAIFNCSAAGKNIALAANLAFKTRLPRSEAIAILRDTPAASSPSEAHSGRAARNPNLGSATGTLASDPSDRMVARMRAARGLK